MSRQDSAAALLVAVLWGLNIIAGKIGVGVVPPLLFSAIRFVLVAALIIPFFPVERRHWWDLFVLSACFGTGHFGLMFVGLAGVDAATVAIVVQLGVPFSILVSWIVFKERFGWRRSLGLCLAFLGVVLLAGEPRHASSLAFILLVIGSVFWAVSNVLVKRMQEVNPFAMTGWLSMFAAPQLFVLSLIFETGQTEAVVTGGWPLIATLAYTAIGASIIAHGTWYRLLHRYPVNTVVPYSMLIPIIGVSAGLLILDEPLTWQKAGGGALTLTGVGIIQWRMIVKSTVDGTADRA